MSALVRAAIDAVHAAFGAPGDYGYETDRGRALFNLYKCVPPLAANDWRSISAAPKDGTAFLAYGRHTHSPTDAQRGVQAGDHWWAIILWDVWREPHQWVFAKDGAPTWSPPIWWQPLPEPPASSTDHQ